MKRPCPRCSRVLVTQGYCSACRPASAAAVAERDRGTSAERGYGGPWPRARRVFLAEHKICSDPYKRHVGVIEAAIAVDHIIAVTGADDPRFWDVSNWQALCHACHSYKTVKVDGALRRGE